MARTSGITEPLNYLDSPDGKRHFDTIIPSLNSGVFCLVLLNMHLNPHFYIFACSKLEADDLVQR